MLEIYGISGGDSLLAGDFSAGILHVCVISECLWWLSMETALQEGERCGEWEFQETKREREGGREGGKDGGRYVGRCKNGEK